MPRAPVAAFLATLFSGYDKDNLHLRYVFESWSSNGPLFDFYVATPSVQLRSDYASSNLHFIVKPLPQLERAVLDMLKLHNQSRLQPTFKHSTIHTTLGMLFHSFLGVSLDQYEYWGWVDTDVILGNLGHFFLPAIAQRKALGGGRERRYDVITVQPPVEERELTRRPPTPRDSFLRQATNWGPTLMLNSNSSRTLWMVVEEHQQRFIASVSASSEEERQRAATRSITYTASQDCDRRGCPVESWWTDTTFNDRFLMSSDLAIYEACCALFSHHALATLDGHMGGEGCENVYTNGELLRVCPDKKSFRNRRWHDDSCAHVAPAAHGDVGACAAGSEFGLDLLCSPYRYSGTDWRLSSKQRAVPCIEPSAFHRASGNRSELYLVADHSSTAVVDALPWRDTGLMVRVPALHHHWRRAAPESGNVSVTQIPKVFNAETLREVHWDGPGNLGSARRHAYVPHSGYCAVPYICEQRMMKALARAVASGEGVVSY